MSDNIDCESLEHVLDDGKVRKSVDSCQSPWIAHWIHTSSSKVSKVHKCSSSHGDDKGQGGVLGEGQTCIQISVSKKSQRLGINEEPDDVSQYKKKQRCGPDKLGMSTQLVRFGKQMVADSTSVDIRNKLPIENSGNLISSNQDTEQSNSEQNIRLPSHQVDQENYAVSSLSCKTRPEKLPLPKVAFGGGSGNTLSLNEEFSILDRNPFKDDIPVKSVDDAVDVSLDLGKSLPTKTHSHEEQLARVKQVISYDSPPEKNLSDRLIFQDDLTGSISKSPMGEFKARGMTSQNYTSQKGVDKPSLALPCKEPDVSCLLEDHEQHSHHIAHVLLGSEEITKQLIAKSSQNHNAQKKIDSLKPSDDTLMEDFHHPVISGEKGRETTFRGLQPSHRSPRTMTAVKDVLLLGSFPNAEASQVSATVDSAKGVPDGPLKFSKTVNNLLITKTTEVNLPRRGCRVSTAHSKFEGCTSHEMIAFPSIFYSQGKKKAKSEDLENSTCSEKNGGGDVMKSGFLHAENESSFEGDTMSLGINGHRNSLSGAISSPSDKVSAAGQNKENTLATASINKEGIIGNMTIMLPEINKQHAAELTTPSSVDERGLSTSRTESLGAEHLSHDDQLDNSNFSPHHDTVLGPEPSSLWIKRLMLQAAEPIALGAKNLRTCDPSSSGKVNFPLGTVMNCVKTSPDLIPGKHLIKMPQQSDKTMLLSRGRETFLMSLLKKYPDLSASRPWIYRWLHHQKGPEQARPVPPLVVCEPECSKATDVPTEHFPSVAAMALMGKAVSNFRPCEFRKRGSLIVWNTEGFEKS